MDYLTLNNELDEVLRAWEYIVARNKGEIVKPVLEQIVKTIKILYSCRQARQEAAREIFEVYDSYIKILGEEIDSLMGLALSHGWQSAKVKEGEKCRADIQSLKDKFLGGSQ